MRKKMRGYVPPRKRYLLLGFSIFILFTSCWLSIFFQQKQHLIGGGINRTFLFLLINAHLIVSIILLYLIIRNSIKLYIERRKEIPGSAFKRNLLFSFVVFSLLPVIFVFFIAGKLITTSIDHWFDVRLGRGLEHALYLHEQQTQNERSSILQASTVFKKDLHSHAKIVQKHGIDGLVNVVKGKKSGYDLYDVYLWHGLGDRYFGAISDEVAVWRNFRKVNDRTTKSLRQDFFKHFRGLKNQNRIFDFYGSLYSIQKVSHKFLGENKFLVFAYRYPEHIRYPLIHIQTSIKDYSQLKSIRNPIYWNYFFTFLLITLLILFLSIWCAFYLARGISKPIQELLLAIRKIRKGDLSVRVANLPSDDLQHLVVGFNDMTRSLQRAYQHLEFHNSEMMTMLEHIKESVFFINNYGRVLSFNESAKKVIAQYLNITRFKNKKINFFGPYVKKTFFSLVRELHDSEKSYVTKEISFTHEGEQRTFMIYIAEIDTKFHLHNAVSGKNKGVVVVAEDLSEMYKVNKIKTWQEAAKQMAHEVKNPLTPIQLATQRLQRKLRKSGNDDPVLIDCTETILHQVKIIKDLVSHFSEFAKMPGSVIEQLDINKIITEIRPLYEMSYPDITFSFELQKFLPGFKADKKKMKRVVINLLDNSVRALQNLSQAESITEKQNAGKGVCEKNVVIKTGFKTGRNQIELIIADSGPGIPRDVRGKLFLPYVSSGSKNMGLGLAIVHDIVRQTGGSIKLLPSSQGAVFQILLPL